MSDEPDIFDKLLNLDRRILYFFLFVAVSAPLISPIGVPVKVTPLVRNAYDRIEALESGDNVLLHIGVNAGTWPNTGPQGKAIVEHIFSKPGVKILMWPTGTESERLFQTNVFDIISHSDKVYGEDWAFLTYTPGDEQGMAVMLKDFKAVTKEDTYGTSLNSLSVLDTIKSAGDIDLVISDAGGDTIDAVIRQMNAPYGLDIINTPDPMYLASSMPYVTAGQLVSMVIGGTGASEYEILTNNPGEGAVMSDSISLGHVVVVTFVIIGNVCYLATRDRGGKK